MSELPSADPECDGVVCYAGVDWWYHNRGHSECQIMRRLAPRVPVLWVNSIGMRVPRPGRTELPLARWSRKLRSTLKGLQRDPSGLWVYSPLFLPRYTQAALGWNGRLLHRQTALLARRLGIRRPAAWVTIPSAAPAVERGRFGSVVFNRSDDFSSFPEVDAPLIRSLEERLFARADHTIYVNRLLFERERGRVREAHYLGHGVDFDHFAGARARAEGQPVPDALAGLEKPIVGFYGALDDYTIDLDLLVATARRLRPGTLVVIGFRAMEIDALLREPNVRVLDPVPYEILPRYAAHFDVALMPWLRNEWIEYCNPIKLKEYLALGLPVVTIRFPELAPYEDLVYGADSREEFLAGLDAALAERSPEQVERRRDSVREDSWDAVAERAAELLRVRI